MIGAQPAQALLDLLDDVAARQSRGGVEAPLPGLGGEHHLVAATGERAAEDLLGGFALRSGGAPGRSNVGVEPYTSAVSKKLMPRSSAAPTTPSASWELGATPKVAVPTQTRDTRTPVGPRTEYFI